MVNQSDPFDVPLDANIRRRINFGSICRKMMFNESCAECTKSNDFYRKAKSAVDSEKEGVTKLARDLYARSRIFMSAFNMRDEDKSYPLYIYAIPPAVYDELMGNIGNFRVLNLGFNMFHPVTGHSAMISKRGSGLMTRYSVTIDNKPTPLPNKEILEKLQSLDFSCLFNLDEIIQFVESGYRHIMTLNQEQNLLRFAPAFDGQRVYKEVFFHRFSVEQVLAFNSSQSGNFDDSIPTIKSNPVMRALDPSNEGGFDPLDFPPVEDELSKPLPAVHLDHQKVNPIVGTNVMPSDPAELQKRVAELQRQLSGLGVK